MNDEIMRLGLEVMLGMIAVPWLVWVTVQIFNLKQENALIKQEMGLVNDLHKWLKRQPGFLE